MQEPRTMSDQQQSTSASDEHYVHDRTASMPPPAAQAPRPRAVPTAGTAAPWASSTSTSMPPPTGAPWTSTSRPSAPQAAGTAVQASTTAPWAKPAVGPASDSHPHSGMTRAPGEGMVSTKAGLSEPTKAPVNGAPRSGHLQTGQPVEQLIAAAPCMPGSSPQRPSSFKPAAKWISSEEDLRRFLASDSIKEFVGFIMAVNEAVKSTNAQTESSISAPVAALRAALDSLWRLVDETPPVQQALRYGNPAYRTWHSRMEAAAPALLQAALPPDLQEAAVELVPYFTDSFGNATRIDYGTGHETTFVALLFCMAKLGVVQEADMLGLVNHVFTRYLELMRHVQTTYWLEPAGSHGVWGLDDYQFLPFVWGSAQLIGHGHIRPKSITNTEVLEGYANKYLYLGCIKFVLQVKKGPLQETSPTLNDISGVKDWTKVNSGLLKMYQVEVLSKLPIMQHFLFGSLLQKPS